ncbi:MAG TPA: acyl-CoA-binding protein, partial [Pseudogulbenkiania sp.]|nr:acyl-CoA-binding protein [Pseudogulbenkiania sp.]
MSDLQTLFTQAQADVKTLAERPDNQTLLQLYSLFKQA